MYKRLVLASEKRTKVHWQAAIHMIVTSEGTTLLTSAQLNYKRPAISSTEIYTNVQYFQPTIRVLTSTRTPYSKWLSSRTCV